MKTFLKHIKSTRGVNWLILLIIILVNISYKYWKEPDRIIVHDVIEYYAFLPSIYIYQDKDMSYKNSTTDEVRDHLWFLYSPTYKNVLKTTNGLSILYSPFFAVSHWVAKIFHYPADGYSSPYKMGLIISSIFYLGLGLFFLRKTLSLFFDDLTVALTSVIVVLGTNIFNYVTMEPANEHIYGFFMLMAFIYYSIKWHAEPNLKYSTIIGILAGLISLSRPSNILIVIFFLLWKVVNFRDLFPRIKFLLKQYKWIIWICLFSFLVWIPQIIYWNAQTGHWFYFSYGDDEKFFWNDPKIIDGLFSYRKGWLVYTPLMTFSLLGFFLLKKQLKDFRVPIIIFTLTNFYILFSWWCWWYGGSFGMRALIDSYALMAIPLAAFIQFIFKKSKFIWAPFVVIVLLLIGLNQFQSQQYRLDNPSVHWDAMTKKAYWTNFLKYRQVPNFYNLLSPPDYEAAKEGKR